VKTLRIFSDFFIYSNIFISFCASAATYQTYLIRGEVDWNYLALVFCSTFVFYNGQRIFLSKNYTEENSSERHKWILKNKKLLIVLCAFACLASIPLIITWNFKMILMFGVFSVVSSFYFLPKINLRAIPGVKAVYIALLWTFSTVFFPLLMQQEEIISIGYYFHLPGFFSLLQRFFFILALSVAFNIRDISIDKKKGVKTLPVLFGETKTKILCVVLIMIFFGMIPPSFVIGKALFYSAIITGVVILFASEKRREYYYSFLMDGMIVLQAALVFFFST